jgi:uncharacterized protein (TIGR02996 family)
MSTGRAGFWAAILADPGDDSPRQAYADWLRETGDPHDEAHGRFLAAGLVLHHCRAPEDGNEGPYYDAIRDQADTARDVIAAQAAHLLGWGGGKWAWDNDAAAPGRITARLLPPASGAPARALRTARRTPPPAEALVYERGCVAEVRLATAAWGARGRGLLERCPLTRVELLDVPGLSVRFERAGPDLWRAAGTLTLGPARPARPADPRFAAVGFGPERFDFVCPGPSGGWPRAWLCGHAWQVVTTVGANLRPRAGLRWPGPPDWPDGPAQDDVLPGLGRGDAA